VSKESRRQQRAGRTTRTPQPSPTGGRPASHGPSGAARAGRRERPRHRPGPEPSRLERYRTLVVIVVVVAAIALVGGFVFVSATKAAYNCTTIWTPSPTASPAPDSTNAPGYTQPDMGGRHVAVGTVVTYQYCAPASGTHYDQAGAGPIKPGVYGPNDAVIPQGWVHNLEHGALVVLYKGSSAGATQEGQQQLQAFYDAFPNSPVCNIEKGTTQGPVIARFDQMATDYSAMVWGRVLPLTTLDTNAIMDFYAAWGEKTNPQPQCAPTASPTAIPSASPSESTVPSTSPSPIATPAPSVSAEPSASPS
jgi:Protein of unknown function (DUF3105)